jgi:3',5'-cyclic AMP phosphodiesterase CpdA
VFVRQLRDSERRGHDFTVQLGDMVSRGSLKNFLEFFKKLVGVSPQKPYLTVIGNHDRRKPHGVTDSRVYRSLFGKTDYFFEHGGVRFITLDSSAGRVTDDQLEWFASALNYPGRKIVFTHMPPSAIKPWGPDGGNKTWGGFKDGSDAFAALVSRANVERVYVGHIHGLRMKDYKGVRYVITGGGGSPLYPGGVHNNFHHYLTVEVTPNGLREVVHRADGTSFEVP